MTALHLSQHPERPCDFCDERIAVTIENIDGKVRAYHDIEDPEGVEGIARVPCPRWEAR